VISPTQITCTLPITGRAAGQWNVAVINPDGQTATLANGFTVTSPSPGNTPIIIDPSKMNPFEGMITPTQDMDGGPLEEAITHTI
jgi:hypothetical protein